MVIVIEEEGVGGLNLCSCGGAKKTLRDLLRQGDGKRTDLLSRFHVFSIFKASSVTGHAVLRR